jgi:hypothetical protein
VDGAQQRTAQDACHSHHVGQFALTYFGLFLEA